MTWAQNCAFTVGSNVLVTMELSRFTPGSRSVALFGAGFVGSPWRSYMFTHRSAGTSFTEAYWWLACHGPDGWLLAGHPAPPGNSTPNCSTSSITWSVWKNFVP